MCALRKSAFVDAALRALESRGFSAIGVFTSSLRIATRLECRSRLRLLPDFPDIIVNTVSFPVFTFELVEARHHEADGHTFEVIGAPASSGGFAAGRRRARRGVNPRGA